MNVVKTISTELDNLSRRLVKFLRFGKSDVQTALESAPFGIDSNPVKDMVAIYASTGDKGKSVLIGYIQPNQLAATGEIRLFSTNTSGDEQIFIWLKNNGTIEMGGNADNLVRYAALNTELQTFKNKINEELTKIQAGIAGVGGAYTPLPLLINISDSKIDEIKTL